MADERFPSRLRLRRQVDFDRVYRHGAHAADEVLVVNVCPNRLPVCRLGLSVSRKVGSAVVRNRWKRWIREAFRRTRHELPPGLDIVARPRRGAESDFAAVARSLPRLVVRAARRQRGGR